MVTLYQEETRLSPLQWNHTSTAVPYQYGSVNSFVQMNHGNYAQPGIFNRNTPFPCKGFNLHSMHIITAHQCLDKNIQDKYLEVKVVVVGHLYFRTSALQTTETM